jgi:hypothetical protein
LFKYLDTLCAEFRINNRKSGHIPARMSQARDQPALHGVNGVGVDDWNRRCRVLDGEGCGCCDHYYDIGLQPNHFSRKVLKPFRVAFCIPAFDNEVLPLHVAQFAQTLEQSIIKTLISVGDKPKPPSLACD